MRKPPLHPAACLVAAALAACGGDADTDSTMLQGTANVGSAPLAGAAIRICDAKGAAVDTTATQQGRYRADVSALTPPLLVVATNAPFVTINSVPQPANGTVAYAALLPQVTTGANNTANVNALTDKIASDTAVADLSLKGSVQLINACSTAGISAQTVSAQTAALRALVLDALRFEGVAQADAFDPVTTTAGPSDLAAVLDRIIHSRDGWGSGTDDQLRGTRLYDRRLQELAPDNVALDPALPAWSAARSRIFIVGDSTASNYPRGVAPRMGWGQAFAAQLADGAGAQVVNLAQSGRSSRSFITEGWFALLAAHLQAGDHLLIQWGHNDEKCDVTGSLDWVNRCTYPNDTAGLPRRATTVDKLPPGTTADDLSFQKSLEKYVQLASDKGATPVLITPVTRINQDKSVTTYVEGAFPIARSTHVTSKGDAPGDYTQTVIDTARARGVVVVDLDAASRAWVNTIGVGTGGARATGGWRDYYLSVSDAQAYPFYASASTVGHYLNADRTHFQATGAAQIAALVAQGIKAESARLPGLAAMLK